MALTDREVGVKIQELQGDVIHFFGISKESSRVASSCLSDRFFFSYFVLFFIFDALLSVGS